MLIQSNDIKNVFTSFCDEASEPYHRYYSFDLCYSHFRNSKLENEINIEQSCFVLWSYLGSWGMLRGSGYLLKTKNPLFLKELVEWIYCQDNKIWEIDVEDYNNPKKVDIILEIYQTVCDKITDGEKQPTKTLVTKIILGVFGILPAFDSFFCKTFGFSSSKVTKRNLIEIYDFYLKNKQVIDELQKQCFVRDSNHNLTNWHYTKAKIIDMYGFQKERNSRKRL
ncbi:hypothetical protein QV01_09180 [Gallibacterium genomosp. 3]|uniref:Uncharacterized protein n=1 Tax=Gallibacterium genomosp. 3 TaxID=505345 RepID=A0A1A7NPI6_9PAST|nr:hypothetical protein [Gallibacterium genomosp. 3]OBW90954.1 hypothetical protein QV01_09180 [Gallibacterium genomosp. 3]